MIARHWVGAGGVQLILTAAFAASGSPIAAQAPVASTAVRAVVDTAADAAADTAGDTAGARAGLREFASMCHRDAGRVWGGSLCGPILLVDAGTRTAVASDRPGAGSFTGADGVFAGRLPDSVGLGNTAIDWAGKRWAMVLLPLPADAFGRMDLLAHESFHRIQSGLHLNGPDAVNGQLDEQDGRMWLRLELHALAYALCTAGDAARRHARSALLFRAARRRRFPGADTLENALELQEGLAAYTGARFALAAYPVLGPLRVVREMDQIEGRPTYVRSFAYATGPAWGLLLDRYAPGWRARITRVRDLGEMARTALGVTGPLPPDSALRVIAEPYGYASIVSEERARAAAREVELAAYRKRLISGPTLSLHQTALTRAFNPNTLVPLDTMGTVFPTGSFGAVWGKLDVQGGGALVAADFSRIRVAAPADAAGRTLRGDDWVLDLNPGYHTVPGTRPGDYEVVGPSLDSSAHPPGSAH
jgi:hypothetical protein